MVLSASALQAAQTAGLSRIETSKPWSISASLRGFYDDNYTTSPNSIAPNSFGMEFTPSVSLNLPLDQTFIGLSYVYSMRYYENRPFNSADHTHQANFKLGHAFTERYRIDISDSFVVAQEPQLIDPNGIITSPIRTSGNNIRNTGSADFTAQLSQLVTMQLGYANSIYDYEQSGTGSRSALLDRMEHLLGVNFRWQMLPQTIGVIGYNYGYNDYTSKDPLYFALFPSPGVLFGPVSASTRDNRSHFAFIGVDQNFNSQLNASARVGVQAVEFVNLNISDVGPYADATLTYTYAPGSYLQGGVRHQRNATDVTAFSGTANNLTTDQESTAVYVAINHQITGKLSASILGQYQHSTFQGGAANDLVDNFFIAGLNLSYRINPHWTAETGYNFDRLDSDLGGRSYTRNRVYVGIRATY
jgi:hypothetical protein